MYNEALRIAENENTSYISLPVMHHTFKDRKAFHEDTGKRISENWEEMKIIVYQMQDRLKAVNDYDSAEKSTDFLRERRRTYNEKFAEIRMYQHNAPTGAATVDDLMELEFFLVNACLEKEIRRVNAYNCFGSASLNILLNEEEPYLPGIDR